MPLWVDPSGREPRPAALRLVGLAVVALVACGGVVVAKWSQGDFADRFLLTVVSNRVGDGLATGADVKYRGYAIGEVSGLAVGEDGRQRVQLTIDPAQAAGLTTDLVPVYRATNMFAATGVELVPASRRGGRLRSGAELVVRTSDTALGTMTSVLSRVGKLAKPLSDTATLEALNMLVDDADPYIDLVRNALPLLSGIAADQKVTVTQALHDMSQIVDVIKPAVGPILNTIDLSLDASGYLDTDEGLNQTVAAVKSGLADRFTTPLGRILGGANTPYLKSLIAVALDFAVPAVVSVGTVPDAYNRLNSLIRSTGDAFANQPDGKVRLLAEVLLTNAPQIATPLLHREVNRGVR
ncbi:MlaD family protein [Gordonia sp. MP11Mi]|uniref:Mce/MlaD domain-containing protein n=1 Tax=Gordonia sp. MP11Mi TaxID=3022769 RepID=A0AA97GWU7_9ACTN